jgi:alanine racemase
MMRELVIDLDAIEANLNAYRKRAPGAKIMAVVKADAYGHGMFEVALKLDRAKVDYFGVADVDEALHLREGGLETPILAWLHDPNDRFTEALAANIELSVANLDHLERVADAARLTGKVARVHLKVDTGLSRNGSTIEEWPALVTAVVALCDEQLLECVGVFSHLSSTSEADDRAQIVRFDEAVETAKSLGLDFELRHLTASDGTLNYPDANYEMVRIGVGLYGLSPFVDRTSAEFGLRPAMTARALVTQTKRVKADVGISYGYMVRTKAETTLALVPIGYAEGLPRNASGKAEVSIKGKRYKIESRIAMDQFVVDVGDDDVSAGDEVVLFGDPSLGVPSADELAVAADTINYEIVTRMGGRFRYTFIGAAE